MSESPESDAWFRVTAVLRCAFEVADEDTPAPRLPVSARPAADAARVVVARISRSDADLREVARALLDAIDALEQEVERLRVRLDLAEEGIDLTSELVQIGGDGMSLERRLPYAPGARLRVWLELPLDGQDRLVATLAEVMAAPDGTRLQFIDTRAEFRDRVVAFAFQQQAQERRRARDRSS